MASEIGAYEAKTHLPRLLREVAEGKTFTISVRGKPVAVLQPIEQSKLSSAQLRDRLRTFHDGHAMPSLSRQDIKTMLEEGRD